MDDDSPDDVVHREFAEQVFEGHPLGRDTAGERGDGRLAHRRRDQTLPRRALSSRQHGGRRRRRRGHRRDRRAGRLAFAAFPSGDGQIPRSSPCAIGRRHDDPRRHRAGAPHRGWSRPATARPRPRGARRRQPCARRWTVEPAVRRDPRAPRPRLQRVLGHRRRTPTRARGRCTPARCREHAATVRTSDRRRARPARRRRHHRRGVGDRQGLPHRARTRWASRIRGAHVAASAGCS